MNNNRPITIIVDHPDGKGQYRATITPDILSNFPTTPTDIVLSIAKIQDTLSELCILKSKIIKIVSRLELEYKVHESNNAMTLKTAYLGQTGKRLTDRELQARLLHDDDLYNRRVALADYINKRTIIEDLQSLLRDRNMSLQVVLKHTAPDNYLS
jgi:hypothetical protein